MLNLLFFPLQKIAHISPIGTSKTERIHYISLKQ